MLNISQTETKMELLLEDLIINLGHVGPAVRKAAVDCLRTYMKYSSNSNAILKALVHRYVENTQAGAQANVVQGIIMAVPFLVLPKTSEDTLKYVLQQLLEKTEQMTHQETSLRSLVRIKYMLGEERFQKLLKACASSEACASFEKLCDTYDLNAKYKEELNNNRAARKLRSDFNQNVVEDSGVSEECGDSSELQFEVVEDKVILETEIQLNSGSAITMQIHEESRQSSCNEVTDSEEDTRYVFAMYIGI